MLTAILMLGVSAANIALQNEKAARNDRNRQIALQAAEAGLRDAELDIEGPPDGKTMRSTLFAGEQPEIFTKDCGRGRPELYLGLCSDDGATRAWQTVDFMDESEQAGTVPYGHFTGQVFQTGHGSLPVRLPRYIIEMLSTSNQTGAGSTDGASHFYRITAVGFGVRETTQVALQALYRKTEGGNHQTTGPVGRIGWREIHNWEEWRNAAGD